MNNVTVSIVTFLALDHAKKCIASVLAQTPGVKLILTANGCPPAAAYFRTVAGALVIEHPHNLGFGRAHNRAFEKCETEYFLALNDDTIVGPSWLERLMQPFRKFPDAALSCPQNTCSALHPNFHGTHGAKEYCEGSCLLIKSEVARKHGLFDETLPGLAYGEDSQLSLQYRQLGYTLHWVDANVRHAVAQTSRKIPEVKRWQELNHAVLRKRWEHYLRVRTMDYPIILKRAGAHGDVLLLTPVIRCLKKQRPLSPIYVETACPDVLANNPHIKQAAHKIPRLPNELRIVLDGAYEAKPADHFVKSYAERAGVTLDNTKTEIYTTPADVNWAEVRLNPFKDDPIVAIFAGPTTWPSKNWPAERFTEVARFLENEGYAIVLVGADRSLEIPRMLDLREKTSVGQLAEVLRRCAFVVTLDSFPLHVAQAVGTTVFPLFGVTLPGPILTEGSKAFPICSNPHHPASGLRHKQTGKTMIQVAENPMLTISAEDVIARIKQETWVKVEVTA